MLVVACAAEALYRPVPNANAARPVCVWSMCVASVYSPIEFQERACSARRGPAMFYTAHVAGGNEVRACVQCTIRAAFAYSTRRGRRVPTARKHARAAEVEAQKVSNWISRSCIDTDMSFSPS